MQTDPLWPGIAAPLVLLVAAVLIRRVLLHGQRRGTASIPLFVLAVAFRLLTGAAQRLAADRAANALEFGQTFFFALGLANFVDMVLFDAFLERVQRHVPRILRDMLQAAAFIVITFVLLGARGVDVLPLVTTSAVLTAVVGLALQGTIANLFAGLSLQLDRSFGIGDWIRVGGHAGKITQIRWRSTSLLTIDGDLLVIPNQYLTANEVLNLSAPTSVHRVAVSINVDYAVPPNEVKRVFVEALRGLPGVAGNPSPTVVPAEFRDFSIRYALHYWIDNHERDVVTDGEVRTRVYYAARRAGFELAPPQKVLYIADDVDNWKAAAPSATDLADRSALLRRIDVLAPLSEEDRQSLISRMRRVRFAAGETLIRQGDPGDSLYLIHLGEVAVVVNNAGEEREVSVLGPTSFIGEISLVTGEPRAATCRAKTDVVAYVVDHGSFQMLLEARPNLAEDLSIVLAQRMVVLGDQPEPGTGDLQRRKEASGRVLARIRKFFNLA